jgi:hypothetical protein
MYRTPFFQKKGKIMKKLHNIKKIAFVKEDMILEVDSKEYNFRLVDISKKLADASTEEREKFEISPAGYGIHWPLIDEDLSIDGLIAIKGKQPQSKKSISA